LHIGIFFSVPYWKFYIAKPAMYIPKPAIENFTKEKGNAMRGCRKRNRMLVSPSSGFFPHYII
jgi:hypothetical protein